MFDWIPLPYKLLGITALVVGAFLLGLSNGKSEMKVKLQNLATDHAIQVADLERKNKEISNKTVTQYIDKVRVVKEKEYVYRDLAKTVVPQQHVMSNGWVYTHDSSAQAIDADPTRASDAAPSGITDTQALVGIVGNYSRCLQNTQQLIALQRWIADNKEAVDKVAAEAKK